MSTEQTTEIDSTADTTSTDAATTTETAAATATETATDTTTDTTSAAGDGETFSKEYVEKLRREAAGYREKAKTDAASAAEAAKNEITQSLGKALGLIKDEETADPAALVAAAQAERTQALEDARATKVELAVLRNADKHNANTEELLDSRDFAGKLKDLDPTADDFASQVDALIKAAVDGNPTRFKRVQVATSAGGATHTGETAKPDPENQSIDDIRKERQKRRERG